MATDKDQADQALASRVSGLVSGGITAEATRINGSGGQISVGGGYLPSVRAAVMANQGFSAALSDIRQADASIDVARAGLKPQLSAQAMAGAGRSGGSDTETGATGGLSVSQLLYDGGGTAAGVDAAVARAYASRYAATAGANDIGHAAALAWVDLWQSSQQLTLVDSRLAEVQPLLTRLDSLISSGLGNRGDMASARRQFLDLELERQRTQAALDDARNRFSRYYNHMPARVPAPERLFSSDTINQLSASWANAPALIAAAAEVVVAEHNVTIAEAQLRPQLALQASADAGEDDPELTAGLQLRYTFGDGGRRRAEVKARQEYLSAAQLRFEDQRARLRSDIDTTLSRLRTLDSSMGLLNQRIRALEDEKDTLRSQLSSGQSSMRQLVESEVLYYRALSERIALQGERHRLELAMSARLGHLLTRLGIDIAALP